MKKTDKHDLHYFRGRIWIDGPEGTYISYARIVLLERIRDHGSISAAARSMEISYRHAWKLVDSMNSQSQQPFVVMRTGGKGGGGAVLTDAGEEAIETFRSVYKDFVDFLSQSTKKLIV